MKILHVIHSLDPRSGGPSHALRSLVREQVRRGHEISVLGTTTQSAEPWSARDEYVRRMLADEDFAGAEVHLARAWGRRRPWSRYAYSPAASRWLRRRMIDACERPDIVHVHGTFSHVATVGAAWARRFAVPYILRPAGSLDRSCLRGASRWLKSLFVRKWLQRDLDQAALIHATSTAEADELTAWAPEQRIRTVFHGVPWPILDGSGSSEVLYASFPELRDRRIVLCLARLHPIKRPDLLVDALARLAPEHPDLVLVLSGQDAGARQAVESAVRRHGLEGRVLLTGFLQGQAKTAAFRAASVFALPSRHENFGVSVVEAMAHATPVLVTRGVASHVYVDASDCGLTVDDSVDGIARGIHSLLLADRDVLGRRGRRYVERHLTWPAIIEQLDEMYHDAIAPSSAKARVDVPC